MIDIQNNISLKKYNTLRVDAQAKFFVVIKSAEEFTELLKTDIRKNNTSFILGGGANILFTKDFDGIVVKNEILGKEIVHEDETYVYIKVGSGELWPAFVNRCVEQNFAGIENLAFIPGTVGASAVGNIGAYGVEVRETIDEIEYIEVESPKSKVQSQTKISPNIKILKNEACKFSYRESVFKQELKGKVLITSVTFKLYKIKGEKDEKDEYDKHYEKYKVNLEYKDIQQAIDEQKLDRNSLKLKDVIGLIVASRLSKLPDPEQIGTAGSFFKNPIVTQEKYVLLKEKWPNLVSFPVDDDTDNYVKLSAGQLIELSGLKGHRRGNAGISSKHALVLINLGEATGEEIVQLADHIVSEVKKNFQVTLDPEVIYV